MKIMVFVGAFAAAYAYASPMADGKWQSRAIGAVLACIVATAGVLAAMTAE
jgi:hypothetical protein